MSFRENVRDQDSNVRKTVRIESTSLADQSRLEINTGKPNSRNTETSS